MEERNENVKRNFSDMTDEEIVKIIKETGNHDAQDYILDKYKRIVKLKARSYFLSGAGSEDIIQEGMIGLYKAVRDYQADRNASFRVFADLCINRQIITAIKASTRQKHIPLNSYVSLNKATFDDDSSQSFIDFIPEEDLSNPETVFIGQEDKNLIENHIGKVLSGFEIKVLHLYLQGKSYAEIALEVNKPEKSIDNALQRVKRKVEKFMKDKNEKL